MDKRLKKYNLVFSSLKDGEHEFEYVLDDAFFACFEQSTIEKGEITVVVNLHKSETMLSSVFALSGAVTSDCYRCNSSLKAEITNDFRLVFKFGQDVSDNEELIVLAPEEYQIDFSPYFYEFAHLSLPKRIVHPDGECDEEMQGLMEKYLV